jgi:hypothetical protein
MRISVTANGGKANAGSAGAAVSGDNRKGRYAGFHSDASNLVAGDSNGVSDVFLWRRPRGSAGVRLKGRARPAGGFQRVSVSSGGSQANGPSLKPSIDGSNFKSPKCVAFQSQATNLSAADTTPDWDVYVRNVARRRTTLVSKGVADATEPSIDGACRRVAFEAGGNVYTGTVGGGVRSLGAGSNPDFSLDGTAIAWERDGSIVLSRNGRKNVVGPGSNPQVSDGQKASAGATRVWGVVFDTRERLAQGDGNSGVDVYMRVFGPSGDSVRTDLISAKGRGGASLGGNSANGGITAYAPNGGILTFVNTRGGSSTLYYRNNNSGNIDDLAHARSAGGSHGIYDVATGARANWVAFTSRAGGRTNVFFKHLTGGEPI